MEVVKLLTDIGGCGDRGAGARPSTRSNTVGSRNGVCVSKYSADLVRVRVRARVRVRVRVRVGVGLARLRLLLEGRGRLLPTRRALLQLLERLGLG